MLKISRIQSKLQLCQSCPLAHGIRRRLDGVAGLRTERRRKFNISSVTDLSVGEARLEELQRVNETKKQEVQQRINRAMALGWVCEGYVDLVSGTQHKKRNILKFG